MTIEPTDIPGVYRSVYWIDLREPHNPQCDCPSGCLSDRICLHIRAAQDYRDGEVVKHWRTR